MLVHCAMMTSWNLWQVNIKDRSVVLSCGPCSHAAQTIVMMISGCSRTDDICSDCIDMKFDTSILGPPLGSAIRPRSHTSKDSKLNSSVMYINRNDNYPD